MPLKTVELREQRAKHIHDAREIIDRAKKENRDPTTEEGVKVDELFAEADKLEGKIETAERNERLERAESSLKEKPVRRSAAAGNAPADDPDYAQAARSFFLRNQPGNRLSADHIDNAVRCGIDLNATSCNLPIAKRALSKGAGIGQALTQWSELYDVFERELKYYGPVLDLVTIRPTATGQPLPIAVADDTASVAVIVAENAAVSTTDPSGTSITLGAFKYTSNEMAVSLEVLQDSAANLESEIGPMLAERFGRGWNAHCTTGVGTTQPFGLTVRAAASGVVSGGTAAAPTFASPDVLFDLADSVDLAYQRMPGAGYMMSITTRSKIRKLKDSAGQYLWQPSVQAGVPDVFNGFPVYPNPDMASTGVNAPLILFGDYKQYVFRLAMQIEVFRLDQLRILNGQIAWVAFARADGNLKKPNAVKKLLAPAA